MNFMIYLSLSFAFLSQILYAATVLKYSGLQSDDFDKTTIINDGWFFDQTPSFLSSSSPWTADCGIQVGRRLFGGYMVFKGTAANGGKKYSIRKEYNDLPPHYQVRFKAKLFKIDSWNQPSDVLYVTMNGVQIFKGEWDCCFSGQDLCGSRIAPTSSSDKKTNYAYNEGIALLDVTKPHTTKNWNVNFTSTHNHQENESWGFREVSLWMDTCHYSCLTCSGPNENDCLSCFANSQKLSDGRCQCIDQTYYNSQETVCTDLSCSICKTNCLVGYYKYKGDVNECRKCDDLCQGGCIKDSTDCVSCVDQYYLDYVQSTGMNKCLQCSDGCKKCTKNTQTSQLECSICYDGYFLFQTFCLKCQDQCATCVTSDSNCTSCNLNLGYYMETSTSLCTKCDQTCQSCTGPNPNQCTMCRKGFFKDSTTGLCILKCPGVYYGESITRTCIQTCPEGYYGFWENKQCEKCHPWCKKCTKSDVNSCLDCVEPYYINGRSCVTSCPSDKYADTINRQCNYFIYAENNPTCVIACQEGMQYDPVQFACVPCDASCALCFGRLPSNCSQCDPPRYLNSSNMCVTQCASPLLMDDKTQTCVAQCSSGYYIDNGYCRTCNHSCSTCTANNTCTTCDASMNRVLDTNTGLCVCQTGYYDDGQNQLCVLCPTNPDPDLAACIQCPIDSTYGVCTCPVNYYQNPSFPTICLPCSKFCIGCSGDALKCLACDESQNRYLDPVTGFCECISGTYYDPTNGSLACQPCSILCKSCTGSADICTTCKYEENRVLVSGKCVCDVGYFDNNGICTKCNSNCDNCTNDNQCLQCSSGYYLNINKLCTSDCSQQGDQVGGRHISLDGKTCVDSCSQGEFIDSSNKCTACNPACVSCVTSPNNCLSCKSGTYSNGSSCETTCPDGYYPDNSTMKCEQCDTKCTKCTSLTNCLGCTSNYDFVLNTCTPKCTTGYFRSNVDFLCSKCLEACTDCTGVNSCSACQPNYVLQKGVCLLDCDFDGGYYFDEITNSCQKCHFSCQKCFDNSTKCIYCQQNMTFNSALGICACNEGYIWDESNKTCIQCGQECASCEYKDFKLINCQCPEGKYLLNNQTCKNCINNCKTCLAPPQNTCKSCYGNLVILEGDCITQEEEKTWLQLDDSHNFILIFCTLVIGIGFIGFTVYYLKRKAPLKANKFKKIKKSYDEDNNDVIELQQQSIDDQNNISNTRDPNSQ